MVDSQGGVEKTAIDYQGLTNNQINNIPD